MGVFTAGATAVSTEKQSTHPAENEPEKEIHFWDFGPRQSGSPTHTGPDRDLASQPVQGPHETE